MSLGAEERALFVLLPVSQKICVEDITRWREDMNAKGLIRQLGWKDLCTQRQIQKALMVHKSLNGLVPEYVVGILVSERRWSVHQCRQALE